MDENCKPKKKASTILAVVLLVLLLLYVASSGPAAALVLNKRITLDAYDTAYAPLMAAEQRSDLAARALGGWRGLFVDEEKWEFERIIFPMLKYRHN